MNFPPPLISVTPHYTNKMSSSTIPVPAKPWTVAVFEVQRSHMTNFVRTEILPHLEDTECRRIVVRAPVKSGKREMVEYISMRDSSGKEPSTRVHAFVSAWHRKADEEQRDELNHQNMNVFSITNASRLTLCLAWIQQQLDKGLRVVIHLDECDHGSGSNQTLSKLWREIRNNERINCVLYSATPEEVLYSGEVEIEPEINDMMGEMVEGHIVRYGPPPGYCGPLRFINEGLVQEAFPFIENTASGYTLSDQSKMIVRDLMSAIQINPQRNILVVRLSTAEGRTKEDKAIHQFIRACGSFSDLQGVAIITDLSEKADVRGTSVINETIQWSNPNYWRFCRPAGIPTIIVIDQKSSRSTEWACHDRIFATHDFRNVARFSTISQAVERVNHYEQKYGSFQPIRVYCHKKSMLLSADMITYNDYCSVKWVAKKVINVDLWNIVHKETEDPHPRWPNHVDAKTRDRALQILECYATTSLSQRVTGAVKSVPIYHVEFHPVKPEEWDAKVRTIMPNTVTRSLFRNPFLESNKDPHRPVDTKFQGYLTGRWSVLDFDRDVKNTENWGARSKGADGYYVPQRVICYRGGEVGIAVRIDTKERETKNTLKAFRSMYGSGKTAIKIKKPSISA